VTSVSISSFNFCPHGSNVPIPVSVNSSTKEMVSLWLNNSKSTAWKWLSDNSRCPWLIYV
jgi:hypothetical protein